MIDAHRRLVLEWKWSRSIDGLVRSVPRVQSDLYQRSGGGILLGWLSRVDRVLFLLFWWLLQTITYSLPLRGGGLSPSTTFTEVIGEWAVFVLGFRQTLG